MAAYPEGGGSPCLRHMGADVPRYRRDRAFTVLTIKDVLLTLHAPYRSHGEMRFASPLFVREAVGPNLRTQE